MRHTKAIRYRISNLAQIYLRDMFSAAQKFDRVFDGEDFVAPEYRVDKSFRQTKVNEAADVWTLGLIVYVSIKGFAGLENRWSKEQKNLEKVVLGTKWSP